MGAFTFLLRAGGGADKVKSVKSVKQETRKQIRASLPAALHKAMRVRAIADSVPYEVVIKRALIDYLNLT